MYILAPILSVLLLLFISLVTFSCFYYHVHHQKKCTVRRDQDTIENATSANQDTIENATSANQDATSANQGTIENDTSEDTQTEGIYSLISQVIYDTGTKYEYHPNEDTSAMNEPNNANYSMITFESLTNDKKRQDNQHAPDNYSMITFENLRKTHQVTQHDPEPLDLPDWGEDAYQNVTTLMKNMDVL